MALPTLIRTWQFLVNQSFLEVDLNTTNKRLLLEMKNGFKGAGSGWTNSAGGSISPTPTWAVRGSSNSVSAGAYPDSVDRWSSVSDIVFSSGAHSWIVLRNTALDSQFEVCFDYNTNFTQNLDIVISPGGLFTGGTTSARPTATDSVTLNSAGIGSTSGNPTERLHVLQSQDGKSSRIVVCRNGVVAHQILLEKPENLVSGWPSSNAFFSQGSTTLTPAIQGTIAQLSTSTAAPGRAKGLAGATINLFLTGEGSQEGAAANLAQLLTAASPFSGNYPLFPIGLATVTGSNAGRLGSLADLYWGLVSLADGTTYPAGGTKEWVQFGDLIHPWNGTVPAIT